MNTDFTRGWNVYRVRDLICHVASGPSPTCEERNVRDHEWGLLKTTAVTWAGWDPTAHKLLPREYWGNHAIEVRSGDVVVTKAGPRHRVGVVACVDKTPERLSVSGKMVLLRPKMTQVLPRILAGLLSMPAPQRFLDERTSGMAESQVNFSNSALLETPLEVPPLEGQWRIAEILDSIDERIAFQDRIIEKLAAVHDGLAARLLRDVNVDVERLANYLALPPKNGYSPKEVDEWTGTVALGLGCLTPSGFQARQLKNVPAENAGNASAYLNDGDLLMSRANTRELVGLVGIYREVGDRCIYPDLMMRLSPIESCRTEYLELALRSSAVRRQVQGMAQGTSESMVKISSSIVQNLKVRIPDLAVQNRILEVIDAARARIRAEESVRDELIRLKTGLAEDLLTGRVRVPEAEAVVGSL